MKMLVMCCRDHTIFEATPAEKRIPTEGGLHHKLIFRIDCRTCGRGYERDLGSDKPYFSDRPLEILVRDMDNPTEAELESMQARWAEWPEGSIHHPGPTKGKMFPWIQKVEKIIAERQLERAEKVGKIIAERNPANLD
jgi:hypothetical protein